MEDLDALMLESKNIEEQIDALQKVIVNHENAMLLKPYRNHQIIKVIKYNDKNVIAIQRTEYSKPDLMAVKFFNYFHEVDLTPRLNVSWLSYPESEMQDIIEAINNPEIEIDGNIIDDIIAKYGLMDDVYDFSKISLKAFQIKLSEIRQEIALLKKQKKDNKLKSVQSRKTNWKNSQCKYF